MNKENLKAGTELMSKIEHLQTQLAAWKNAKSIVSSLSLNVTNYSSSVTVETKNINFEVLKTLTVDNIEKQIAELQSEFNNL